MKYTYTKPTTKSRHIISASLLAGSGSGNNRITCGFANCSSYNGGLGSANCMLCGYR